MCGIIGGSSSKVLDFGTIKLGILEADDRGGHGCGIVVRGEEDTTIRQVAVAKTFINDADDDIKIPRKNKTIIAHTRYATHGAKDLDNTHPFIFGDIVGVHNGSIENFKELKEKYIEDYRRDVEDWCGKDWREKLGVEKYDDIDVDNDSKLLYYMIWKKGLSDILHELKGTLALAFLKEEEDGEYLYLYRHDKPLCYGSKDDAIWFSSLKEYLDTIECTDVKALTEHCIYKIQDGKVIYAKQQPKKSKPKEKDSKYNDYDPQLEPEKKKRGARSTGYEGSSGNACAVEHKSPAPKVHTVNDEFSFSAPASAKGFLKDKDTLVLYFFSDKDSDCVYIEDEGEEDVFCYNLSKQEDKDELIASYGKEGQDVIDEYEIIKLTNDFRSERENG